MHIKSTICFLFGVAMCVILCCEHSVDEPTLPNVSDITFNTIHDTVFSICLPCHSGNSTYGGLDLSLASNLINKQSNGVPEIVYILPTNPDSSYIYMKVTGKEGIVGNEMPPEGSLSDDNIETLRQWILDGAPN